MPYKISGTKSETSRVIIIKESDWSIESETIISGSGNYNVEELETGNKLVFSRAEDGEIIGFGNVSSYYYAPAARGVFAGGAYEIAGTQTDIIEYITITSLGNGVDFGDLLVGKGYFEGVSNGVNDRGVFSGGNPAPRNLIQYITISTTGNSTDFGDLTVERYYSTGVSNGTSDRGVTGAGQGAPALNILDYITISSTGNATSFGGLTVPRYLGGACSNMTNNRGLWAGGDPNGALLNVIDYITISSTGDATNFGDLTTINYQLKGTSNGTNNRGVFLGGAPPPYTPVNVIDYVTISSLGDATDFGDLLTATKQPTATSNTTGERGVFGSGTTAADDFINVIEYITISIPGNSTDFGDLTLARSGCGSTSNA